MENQVQEGEQVKITCEINGHQFKMGEWVTVYKVKPEFICATNEAGTKQFGLTHQEYQRL